MIEKVEIFLKALGLVVPIGTLRAQRVHSLTPRKFAENSILKPLRFLTAGGGKLLANCTNHCLQHEN